MSISALPLASIFVLVIFGNLFGRCVSSAAMSSFSRWMSILAVMSLYMGSAMRQSKPYPKPQVSSDAGQMAPDFTLKDQDGKDFKLSNQRGHWVLLFFYRGYW